MFWVRNFKSSFSLKDHVIHVVINLSSHIERLYISISTLGQWSTVTAHLTIDHSAVDNLLSLNFVTLFFIFQEFHCYCQVRNWVFIWISEKK